MHNRRWHICTECNRSLPANNGDKHQECPMCGSVMRIEVSTAAPTPVITNSMLEKATKWATGEKSALSSDEMEGLSQTLMSKDDRLGVVKAMVAFRQAERMVRLLGLTEGLEERLFNPEVLMSLEPKELIRAVSVLQKSIDQAKGFVYEEEPVPATMNVIMNQSGEKGKSETTVEQMSPASRDRVRYAVGQIQKLLQQPKQDNGGNDDSDGE